MDTRTVNREWWLVMVYSVLLSMILGIISGCDRPDTVTVQEFHREVDRLNKNDNHFESRIKVVEKVVVGDPCEPSLEERIQGLEKRLLEIEDDFGLYNLPPAPPFEGEEHSVLIQSKPKPCCGE